METHLLEGFTGNTIRIFLIRKNILKFREIFTLNYKKRHKKECQLCQIGRIIRFSNLCCSG
jgi:hypothetical protein